MIRAHGEGATVRRQRHGDAKIIETLRVGSTEVGLLRPAIAKAFVDVDGPGVLRAVPKGADGEGTPCGIEGDGPAIAVTGSDGGSLEEGELCAVATPGAQRLGACAKRIDPQVGLVEDEACVGVGVGAAEACVRERDGSGGADLVTIRWRGGHAGDAAAQGVAIRGRQGITR